MRIKLDENIPHGLKASLGGDHDVDSVHDWDRCFVVVTDSKLRVRRHPRPLIIDS